MALQKHPQSSSKCEFPTPLPEPSAESAIQQLHTILQERLKGADEQIVKLVKEHQGVNHGFGPGDDEDDLRYAREAATRSAHISGLEAQRSLYIGLWEDVKRIYGENRCLVAVENKQQRIGDLPFVA